MSNLLKKKGFTIIELLVVISIVSILSSVGVAVTKSSKNKAQTAKVKSETGSIKTALSVYEASNGGYPNPEPGVKQLYCVGSTDCALRGKAIADTFTLENGPQFASTLVPFNNQNGLDQGYMYLSCGSAGTVCDPVNTTLFFATPDNEWYDPLGDTLDAQTIPANFNWISYGIDFTTYPNYPYVPSGGGSSAYQCYYPSYGQGTFEVSSMTGYILSSPSCVWNTVMGYYDCSSTCSDASYEFYNIVTSQFPFSFCGQSRSVSSDPCVDYFGQGTVVCNVGC